MMWLREYFGIWIIVAIIGGLLFPFTAIELQPFASLFLFLLMFVTYANIDWRTVTELARIPVSIIWSVGLSFVALPAVVATLAFLTIDSTQLTYGIIFAAATPTAIVAPFFSKILGGNQNTATALLVLSMLLSPLLTPLALQLFASNLLPHSATLLFKEMILIITLPLLAHFIFSYLFPPLTNSIRRHTPLLNGIFLGALIFILFGVAANKFHTDYGLSSDLIWVIIIAFIQNFFLLFLYKDFAGKLAPYGLGIEVVISSAMKNIAIAASILLILDPVAAIAPALGFVAHIFLFSPVIMRRLL